jgi:hypothetical protein
MRITIVVELISSIFLLIILSHRRRSSFIVYADPNSCRRQVECFVCDSREIQECEDSRHFSHINIPTRLCDDYCLKMWTRENETITGDNITSALRYVRRDCHKIFRYHIKKAETCYKHKKHRTDSLCLCGSDRCNGAMSNNPQRTDFIYHCLLLLLLSCIYVLHWWW